jgi:hypothetical protein
MMKTFKDIVSEVAQPISQGEKNFKDLHIKADNRDLVPGVTDQDFLFKGRPHREDAPTASYEDAGTKDDESTKQYDKTLKREEKVSEELKGNQHKIDANKNNKIDAHDFKVLRGETKAKVKPLYDKARPAFKEEIEQVDELSKATMGSYVTKAASSAATHTGAAAAYGGSSKSPDPKKMAQHQAIATKRTTGIQKAVGKLTKEAAEQIVEKVKTTHENPLVTVHDKDGLHTHANLSTANKIFNTKVKHTDVYAGAVKTKDGHETKNNLTFAISKHHASAMKEEVEQVDEISDTTLKSYRTKAMQHRMGHEPGDSAEVKADRNRKTRNRSQGVRTSWNKMIGRYVKVGGNNKKTYEETEVTEADDAVSKQIAAKKDAMQKQIQQKIAQKQMSAMQAKANKRLSNINASSHDDKEMKKGGKEQIVINPPLKEASDLPKAVVSKGHEIAKSLIKHRAKVREPYAVGMAQAKKSAEIKD